MYFQVTFLYNFVRRYYGTKGLNAIFYFVLTKLWRFFLLFRYRLFSAVKVSFRTTSSLRLAVLTSVLASQCWVLILLNLRAKYKYTHSSLVLYYPGKIWGLIKKSKIYRSMENLLVQHISQILINASAQLEYIIW